MTWTSALRNTAHRLAGGPSRTPAGADLGADDPMYWPKPDREAFSLAGWNFGDPATERVDLDPADFAPDCPHREAGS